MKVATLELAEEWERTGEKFQGLWTKGRLSPLSLRPALASGPVPPPSNNELPRDQRREP